MIVIHHPLGQDAFELCLRPGVHEQGAVVGLEASKEALHLRIVPGSVELGEMGSGAEALSGLVRRMATLAVQEALEAEQRDFIGRERYARGPGRGYRSGYRSRRLDTAEGRLGVEVPQVRDAGERYRSRLFDFLRGNSDVMERLAVEIYARGPSTRDIEAAFTNEAGVCLLSRTAVSEPPRVQRGDP